MTRLLLAALCVFAAGAGVRADGPADNQVENVRRIPKLGVEVSDADRKDLEAGLAKLSEKLIQLEKQLPLGTGRPTTPKPIDDAAPIVVKDPIAEDLYADVAIYHRAVDQALRFREFFDAKEIPVGRKLLETGLARADLLLDGKHPWTEQNGLVVRGYVSRLDGTPQPYGVVIPESYQVEGDQTHRCDLWFHGRGETLSELNFIQQRSNQIGQISPADTIVLHPYGRYCNAAKLAGEVDALEALEAVERNYRINMGKLAVRGFSMGGASAWQFAVHYPAMWFAANPGAGFSETPEFLKVFQSETLQPTWYEQTLWRMYDCTGYAANFHNLHVIAYSGEIDKQKQAADIMAAAMKQEGLELQHVIGPMAAHKILPESQKIIEEQLARWAAEGSHALPQKLEFVTYSLKYNTSHWVQLLGLKEHWEQARITIERTGPGRLKGTTKNITALAVGYPAPPDSPEWNQPVTLELDGQTVALKYGEDWPVVKLVDGRWQAAGTLRDFEADESAGLRKRPGLQGPIDDALMDSFLFVRPSNYCRHKAVDTWVHAEMQHAVMHWRQQMRGDARVKDDKEMTDEDIANHNLILWGDAQANSVLAKIADKLPIRWTAKEITAGDRKWDAAQHAAIAVYPNPLNPKKYVVLNSSFTYREYDYLNNARQVPKLPDWAIVDIRTKPNSRFPGKIVDADFFDEQWQLKPPHGK